MYIHREPGMSAGYWLGVDLGGTKILSGLFDDDLKLLARSKQPTSAESGPSAVFGRIVQGVEAVLKEANIELAQIRGMGIGIPGSDRTWHNQGEVCPQPRLARCRFEATHARGVALAAGRRE